MPTGCSLLCGLVQPPADRDGWPEHSASKCVKVCGCANQARSGRTRIGGRNFTGRLQRWRESRWPLPRDRTSAGQCKFGMPRPHENRRSVTTIAKCADSRSAATVNISCRPAAMAKETVGRDQTRQAIPGRETRAVHTLQACSGAEFEHRVQPGRGAAGHRGGEENTVKIWDVKTGEELRTLRGHNGDIHAVAFSPDAGGRWIASAGEDSAVKVWDSQTGKLVRKLPRPYRSCQQFDL